MIAVDASAVLAILLAEPDQEVFRRAIIAGGGGVMTAVNYWEVLVRAHSAAGATGRMKAERLVRELSISIRPIDQVDARQAADAFANWGRRTPANLNLGDCFAYALAQAEGDGLLYKGDDFGRTDLVSALP